MRIERLFTAAGGDPYADLVFVERKSVITDREGRVVHELSVLAPESWGQTAVDMLAQKYLRKAGVPSEVEPYDDPDATDLPEWLRPRRGVRGSEVGRETDGRAVFDRIAGCWTYWGWRFGYFKSVGTVGDLAPEDAANREHDYARAFYDEVRYMLAHQMMAPNSPQWFSSGIGWAYGICGDAEGRWTVGKPGGDVEPTVDRYNRPSVGACYILDICDSLLQPGGITDFITREARVFKAGSGSGANYSNLRGAGEPLSGGGKSSGLLSFLKPIDASAGAIKSGGTTRRSARMIVVDTDHPDIEEYVTWKVREENKVAALVAGAKIVKKHVEAVFATKAGSLARKVALGAAVEAGVPYYVVRDAALASDHGRPCPEVEEFDTEFEGEAYRTVGGQNANNSVRVTDAFMKAVASGSDWNLYWRTEKVKAARENRAPRPCKTIKARDLWDRITDAAWECADPGLQFHDTINGWHPCPEDGEQVATNPCSEYTYLNNTTCNLACLNLVTTLGDSPDWTVRVGRLRHAARLTTIGLDVTVSMSSYPSAEVARGARDHRTVGLGYANVGALLMRHGLAYDSDDGRALASALAAVVHYQASCTSSELAAELGPFPRFGANREHALRVVRNHAAAATTGAYDGLGVSPPAWVTGNFRLAPEVVRVAARALAEESVLAATRYGLRNAQLSLVQPAGTVGLLMGCDTTGLEPGFSLIAGKTLAGGGFIKIVNQSVEPALRELGYDADRAKKVCDYVYERGTAEGCPDLDPDDLPVFDCAVAPAGATRTISVDGHLKMMAAAQPFLSGSISKTCNLPGDASVADVARAYWSSWELGLKCIALYRDGSKLSQPLSAAGGSEGAVVVSRPAPAPVAARRKLPGRRKGYTQKIKVPGHRLYLSTGEYEDGTLGEIFLTTHKDGALLKSTMNALAVAVSIGLQHGVPLKEFVDAFTFTRFEPNGPVMDHARIRNCTSLLDAVFRDLGISYLGLEELAHVRPELDANNAEKSVPAAAPAEIKFDGTPCPQCQQLRMIRNQTCLVCTACGTTTGCA